MASNSGISFFNRFLSLWVLLCMTAGVAVGRFVPGIPLMTERLTVAGISLPIAILIWVMIFPMMLKVDFASIRSVGRNPKGLFLTWIVNWLIKPFSMYALASFFLRVVFARFIPQGLATQYLAGAVLLGAAPCTAMVFVWSSLVRGNPAYTVVQVATNDLIILLAFAPMVKFLLGVGDVSVPYSTLLVSVALFVVIPLAAGVTTAGLFLTLVLIFSSQSTVILENPLHIVLIAVPLVVQTALIFRRHIRRGKSPASSARHRRPCGHDWRKQLL